MARKLSEIAGHGSWVLAVLAATWLGSVRAHAEVEVRTKYAAPGDVANPYVDEKTPPAPAGARPLTVTQPIGDIPNRYYKPPAISWRDPSGQWHRRPPAPAVRAGRPGGVPQFDPFDTIPGVAMASDHGDAVGEATISDANNSSASVSDTAISEATISEATISDQRSPQRPQPLKMVVTDPEASEVKIERAAPPADSPQGCYASAARLARHADSLGELASVIRLCRQGLQYEASDAETAALRRLAAWAYNRRGEAHAAGGQGEEALADFEAAVRNDPQCAAALNNRAISFAQRGRSEAALRDFDRAIAADPNLAIAYRNRGELLASLGKTEASVRDYGQAILQMPNDADLYKLRGHAFHRLGDYEKAEIDLTQSIELAPQRAADAYTLRGNVQAERGKFKAALDDYQQALASDDQWADAYRSKAWLLATCPDDEIRNPRRALVAARQAHKLAGNDDCYVLEALAAAYASNGKFDEAIKRQQQAVERAPRGLGDQPRSRLALYKRHRPLVNQPSSDVQTASHESGTLVK